MTMPTPDAIETSRLIEEQEAIRPFLERRVAKMMDTVQNAVTREIKAGTLTPDKAYLYWLQVHAYGEALANLTKDAKVALAVKHHAA